MSQVNILLINNIQGVKNIIIIFIIIGGMATFPAVINSLIHIIMYSYYLLSSLGPEWQKVLAKWKPRITMLQMVSDIK